MISRDIPAWSGIRESNSCFHHGKVTGYHYINAARARRLESNQPNKKAQPVGS